MSGFDQRVNEVNHEFDELNFKIKQMKQQL